MHSYCVASMIVLTLICLMILLVRVSILFTSVLTSIGSCYFIKAVTVTIESVQDQFDVHNREDS
jgi:hypothetical protein